MGADLAVEVQVNLDAVIVAVTDERPRVLTVVDGGGQFALPRLPSGPLEPTDRTLDRALRRFVRQQAGLEVGYVEQLYTFGDLERAGRHEQGRLLSIAYLALVRESRPSAAAVWLDWYDLYPWEDYRDGQPAVVEAAIEPAVTAWVADAVSATERSRREERATVVFGLSGVGWDGVRVLERYELLYELGLLAESQGPGDPGVDVDPVVRGTPDPTTAGPVDPPLVASVDPQVELAAGVRVEPAVGAGAEQDRGSALVVGAGQPALAVGAGQPALGLPMQLDHRRIVATALGRLRGKLTYRPVVFELLPPTFTLFQLQGLVEALSGVRLHKQNFRRLVERAGLVEGTGELAPTGGRPAELFRFRREVLRERPRPGFGTPWARL
jgi:hypothetical protein